MYGTVNSVAGISPTTSLIPWVVNPSFTSRVALCIRTLVASMVTVVVLSVAWTVTGPAGSPSVTVKVSAPSAPSNLRSVSTRIVAEVEPAGIVTDSVDGTV